MRLWSRGMLIQVCCLSHHIVLHSPSTSSQAISLCAGFIKGRGRLVDGTANAALENGAAPGCVGRFYCGAVFQISALFVLVAVLLLGPFAGQAQAHGLHAALTVQMPANWAETTVSQAEAEAVSAQTGCGVNCCSATGCAAAVLNPAHAAIVVVAIDDSFALSGHAPPRPSPQSTLKRPPRV